MFNHSHILVVLRLTMFSVVMAVHARATPQPVEVDASEHRPQIRSELLACTPLGSTSGQVMEFITTRLAYPEEAQITREKKPATGPMAQNSSRRGVAVIRLDIADSQINPIMLNPAIPMPLESSLVAQWAFDKNDHLIEIFLDRDLDR